VCVASLGDLLVVGRSQRPSAPRSMTEMPGDDVACEDCRPDVIPQTSSTGLRGSLVTCLSPPLTTSADSDGRFLAAVEVGVALGLEVEALGIRTDMGQWLEGIDIDPAAVLATRVQTYRWPSTNDGDASPGMVDDIDTSGVRATEPGTAWRPSTMSSSCWHMRLRDAQRADDLLRNAAGVP
jgi:hypothetical protein